MQTKQAWQQKQQLRVLKIKINERNKRSFEALHKEAVKSL